MSVIRLALYGTLGYVRYLSSFIQNTWECMSHVWPYTGHLGMSVSLLALYGTLGNVRHSSVIIRDTLECMSYVCPYTSGLTRDTVLMFSQVNTV